MTEDEAKTKWCPMVHVRANVMYADGPDDDATKRRIDLAEAEHRKSMCIGSQCMMWRSTKVIDYNDPVEVTHAATVYRTNIVFYCGLAGKP